MIDDATLLSRYVRERDEAAFAEIVQRHLNLVYRAASRQTEGTGNDAADIAQVVFTLLARKAPSLVEHPSLAGWLYTAVHYTACDLQRAERQRRLREQEAQIMQQTMSDAPGDAEWERLRPVLDDAMRDLDNADREAVLLRFFEDRPFADIGSALRVTEDAARMRVNRALEKLRSRLARRGVPSTAAALASGLAAQSGLAAPIGLAGTITSSALAGLAAQGGVAVGSLAFMTTTQKSMTAAGAVALLSLGILSHESHESRDAGLEHAVLQKRVVSLEDEVRVLQGRKSAADAAEELRRSSARPGPTAAPTGQPPAVNLVDGESRILGRATQWRHRSNQTLALLDRTGISPVQKAGYAARMEREAAANQTGTGVPDDVEREWHRITREEIGDSAFEHLKRLLPAQTAVLQLMDYLQRLEIPLERRTARTLLDLLSNGAAGLSDDGRVVSEELLAQTRDLLTPEQMAAWRRLNSLSDLRVKLLERLRAADQAAPVKG